MQVNKYSQSLILSLGKVSLTVGLIKGFYLGFQIDAQHFTLDLGIVFLDIYW